MGAGKKVWGYYPATDTWIPLQVDANGKVVVDMSGISLDDLGDVTLAGLAASDMLLWWPIPGEWRNISRAALSAAIATGTNIEQLLNVTCATPAHRDLFIFNNATGKWECGALVDADIPAGIARDAEVAAAIAAHHDTLLIDADEDTKVDVEEAADEDHVRMDVAGVEAFLLDDAGILTLAKQSSARGGIAAVQNIPNATWTKVNYDTSIYDIQGEFDVVTNHRFDVAVTGIYLMITQAAFNNIAADTITIAGIYKNGASIGSGRFCNSVLADSMALGITIAQLTAGDFIDGRVYQNSGAAKDLYTSATLNFLIVHKLA